MEDESQLLREGFKAETGHWLPSGLWVFSKGALSTLFFTVANSRLWAYEGNASQHPVGWEELGLP